MMIVRRKLFFAAIHQMASPDVTVNLEKVDTNIIIVRLNDKKIKSPEFYDMLLKVNQTSVNIIIIWE